MPLATKIELRPIDENDLDALDNLFRVVWPSGNASRERTKWAFRPNPLGQAPIVGAFDVEKDQIVGARGAIRWPLALSDDRRYTAVQFGGTCVHPEYRRLGLFTRMTEQALSLAREAGVDVIFNVSVKAARAGYEKLGWRYLPGLRSYHRIERPLKVGLSLLGMAGGRTELSIDQRRPAAHTTHPDNGEIRAFLRHGDSQMSGLLSTLYADQFFEWRFANSEHRLTGSSRVGYCAYRVRQVGGLRDLLLGNLWPKPGHLKSLIDGVASAEKVDTTTMWLSGSHPLRRGVIRAGFIPNVRRSLNFGVCPLVDEVETFLDPRRWALISADIDTF